MATTEKDVVIDEDLSEVFDEEAAEGLNEEEKPRSRTPIYAIGGIIADSVQFSV